MYELLTGMDAFGDHDLADMVRTILYGQPRPNPTGLVSASAQACVAALLTKNAQARPGSVADLQSEPFFAGIEWDRLHHVPSEGVAI